MPRKAKKETNLSVPPRAPTQIIERNHGLNVTQVIPNASIRSPDPFYHKVSQSQHFYNKQRDTDASSPDRRQVTSFNDVVIIKKGEAGVSQDFNNLR